MITHTIKSTIIGFADGFVFGTEDFLIPSAKQKTICKILNNMVAAGEIRRLCAGRFYKPQISKFGELPPDIFQTVKDLLEKNDKIIGYLTGNYIFSKLGLTTRIPTLLQIAVEKRKATIVRGNYQICFITQQNGISKTNISVLQFLDSLLFFRDLSDATPDMPDEICRRLLVLLKRFPRKEIEKAKRLVLKYPPSSIALLGAMLETNNKNEKTIALYHAIKHKSFYKLNISKQVLSNKKKWKLR